MFESTSIVKFLVAASMGGGATAGLPLCRIVEDGFINYLPPRFSSLNIISCQDLALHLFLEFGQR